VKVLIANTGPGVDAATLPAFALGSAPAADLRPLTRAGPPRWNPPLATRGKLAPKTARLPSMNSCRRPTRRIRGTPDALRRLRLFKTASARQFHLERRRMDRQRVEGDLAQLTWKRIASASFNARGEDRDETIYVTCRDRLPGCAT